MKVNIEIDCTPVEARQFMGLPDVVPMQTAVMDKMQQQMMSNIDKVSPESLMQTWFSFDPKIVERFQDMFVAMAGLGGPKQGQVVAVTLMDARRTGRTGQASSAELAVDAGRAAGAVRVQFEPDAVAAALMQRAARRRPSGAGAAGIPWPATSRWRRCGAI